MSLSTGEYRNMASTSIATSPRPPSAAEGASTEERAVASIAGGKGGHCPGLKIRVLPLPQVCPGEAQDPLNGDCPKEHHEHCPPPPPPKHVFGPGNCPTQALHDCAPCCDRAAGTANAASSRRACIICIIEFEGVKGK